MLPGIGGVEYLVIAALIIIFVGPKDLPAVLRTFGRWWGWQWQHSEIAILSSSPKATQ